MAKWLSRDPNLRVVAVQHETVFERLKMPLIKYDSKIARKP